MSTEALLTAEYVIAFVPVTPVVPSTKARRAVGQNSVGLDSVGLGACVAQAKSPRAMAAVRSLVHPCVMRIISS